MKITFKTWILFCALALISLATWFQYSYPQLAFINFSINRKKALTIAESYLANNQYDISGYQSATVFNFDEATNRYLQKTIGFSGLLQFIKEHQFDLFGWSIRFFKENQKEEFLVEVSSSTGEVISFKHTIDDTEARRETTRDEAKAKATDFLAKTFDFKEEGYFLKGDLANIRDFRTDYSFTWQRNTVAIPWSGQESDGTGKLLIAVVVAGDEILSFAKGSFLIPDEFNRDLERQQNTGKNYQILIRIIYSILFISSIYFVIVRRNHLAMHRTKRFYVSLTAISFALSLIAVFNFLEEVRFDYSTTALIQSYLLQTFSNTIFTALFLTVAFIMPSLAGELLHHEAFPQKKGGAFLTYAQSTFFSRSVASSIFLGYLCAMVMLGMQAALIKIGQAYWGVWIEHGWITHLSSAYVPFLAMFALAYKAAISEEMLYRLYAFSFGKKYLKNLGVAVIVFTLTWGFAHALYPVYPQWFRGVEVSCLGFFLAFVYLRFGIIPVIVAHYLFDAFWGTSGYLLGKTQWIYFIPSLIILLIPMFWAAAAFLLNRSDALRPLAWNLNKHQAFNLEVLKNYLSQKQHLFAGKSRDQVKAEITAHGWDPAVIDVALDEGNPNK